MKRADILIIAISLVFMGLAIFSQWDKFNSVDWNVRPAIFLLSVCVLVGIFILDAYGWHLILVSMGLGKKGPKESIIVWLLSSVSRYIPGGFWQYASRITMARKIGVDPASATVSLYLETLLLFASSLVVGVPALLFSTGFDIKPGHVVTILIIVAFFMQPKIISLLRFAPGRIGKAFANVKAPPMRVLLGLYFYYLIFWVLFCAVFIGFIYSIYPLDYDKWVFAGATIALSFSVGFIVIFAPGGIGVRESVLYLLLNTIMPSTASLAIAIGSRFWIISGEMIALGLSIYWDKRKNYGR